MKYWLMRKNNKITLLDITEEGYMLRFASKMMHPEEAPLEYKCDPSNWLKKWWVNRSIPVEQGLVEKMLKEAGLICPQEYLQKNLGLSLTDYYWICPIESNLKWEDVNLFENDFRENLMVKIDDSYKQDDLSANITSGLTPNGSLQGQLEKSWGIKDGKRILIKGNQDNLSIDSMNEVFASRLHRKQGYDNYCRYELMKIKNKPYKYGCRTQCYTSLQYESVTAWAVLTSEENEKKLNQYENLINICEKHGVDAADFRKDLEYMIMTDYVLSNRDRHLSNISILRDANTLKFIRMAPIYDTGKSMFVRQYGLEEKDMADCEVNSFYRKESKMLKLVQDRSLVDVSKLPDAVELGKLYSKDENIPEQRIEKVCRLYEAKVRYFEQWQNRE